MVQLNLILPQHPSHRAVLSKSGDTSPINGSQLPDIIQWLIIFEVLGLNLQPGLTRLLLGYLPIIMYLTRIELMYQDPQSCELTTIL